MGGFFEVIPALMEGLGTTLGLFALTLLISLPLGLLICSMRMSRILPVRWVAELYILIFRGTPLMLQLIFFFMGLPLLFPGWVMGRFTAAVVAFGLNYAAYFAEIFRGGIQSIPRGQYEAAQVLGLSRSQRFFRIVLPQVVKRVIPPVGNEVVTLVKDTALVYAIALSDLMREAQVIMMRQNNLNAFIAAGLFYLIMTSIFTVIFNAIEKKLDYYKI